MRAAGNSDRHVPARIVRLSRAAWNRRFRDGLYWYAIFTAVAFHLRVVLFEEPWLARTHAAGWEDYVRRVRRWL
jgi:protein-S-isoprenylcysteine O-methyltransferase Ste14